MDLRKENLIDGRYGRPPFFPFWGRRHCVFFAMKAVETWRRIGFVRHIKAQKRLSGRKGLPVTEETITENLLFDFAETFDGNHFRPTVSLFQAENEPQDGNDLDLFISTGTGYLRFSLQAKLHNQRGKYESIDHVNKQGRQIDLLIQSSASPIVGAIPLYLFYNCFHDTSCLSKTICGHDIDEHQYGCTILNAKYIQRTFRNKTPKKPNPTERQHWNIPNFVDIHCGTVKAVPWIRLFCCEWKDEQEILKALSFTKKDGLDYDLRVYSQDTINPNSESVTLQGANEEGPEATMRYRRISSSYFPKELGMETELKKSIPGYFPRNLLVIS